MPTTSASLVAVCDHCRKKFKVAAMHAGKRVKCKACGEVFTIPGGASPSPQAPAAASRTVTSAPRPAPPRKPAPAPEPAVETEEDPFAALDQLASYAETAPRIEAAPPPIPAIAPVPRPQPAAMTARPVMGYAQPQQQQRRSAGGGSADGPVAILVLLGIGALMSILNAAVEAFQPTGLFIAMTIAMALMVWGGIGILVTAFRENFVHGLACILVPCQIYLLYHIVTRWSDCSGHVGRYAAGIVLVILNLAINIETGG